MENEIKEVTVAPKKRVRPSRAKLAQPIEAKPIAIPVILTAEQQRREDLKEKIARQRALHAKPVVGKFLFNECPGGELKFSFREFPGDPLMSYTLKHDGIYTLPMGVARHLNNRCAYNNYEHNLDGGKAIDAKNLYITTQIHRTNFIPLDYTIDADFQPKGISQVSYASPMQPNIHDLTGR